MSTDLAAAVEDYLQSRHAMGYRLNGHRSLLGSFVGYLHAQGSESITVKDALAWACLPRGTRPRWHAARLAAARGLAAYIHARDPEAAELVPTRMLPGRVERVVPHLYSGQQINALLDAAHRLQPPVRAHTIATVIALMSAVGLRIGEALALDTTDLDPHASMITVSGKYDNRRRLPVHASTITGLSDYLRVSRRLVGSPRDQALFVTLNATRPAAGNVQAAFRAVVENCGLVPGPGHRMPRLHDLRHSFAVNTLIEAHRAGVDVDSRIAALSTYLGHVSPASTYWYLTASPELLCLVNDRVEAIEEGHQR